MTVQIKKYQVEHVLPGMVLGKDIVSARGKTILRTNTILTEIMLYRLRCMGLLNLFIFEDSNGDNKALLRRTAVRCNYHYLYSTAIDTIKDIFRKTRQLKIVPVSEVRRAAKGCILKLIQLPCILIFLNICESEHNRLYCHSVNVGVLAGLIAKWMNYNDDVAYNLIVAGLLHDIALINVSDASLEKHAVLGYEMLIESDLDNNDISLAVLQHHERLDGTGYPGRLSLENICMYAKVIAVADMYDNVTANAANQNNPNPFTAFTAIHQAMFGKLDAEICIKFLDQLENYLIGCNVELNDERYAEVVFFDRNYSLQPVMRTAGGQFIDLGRNRQLEIVKMICP